MPLSRKNSGAPLVFALVRLFSGMQPQVSFQISFFEKRLPAVLDWTAELPVALVFVDVHLEPLLSRVRFGAPVECAVVLPDVQVHLGMVFQVAFGVECLAAIGEHANKRFLEFLT